MSINDKFNSKDNSPTDQNVSVQTSDLMDKEMSETELEGIAAAGIWVKGTEDDDFMIGSNENNVMDGKGGEDILVGGAGNDMLDGGCKDGADDIVYGGDGNDLLFWGPTQDGSDVFFGGEGNDEITLDLTALSENNIHDAYDNGTLDISLVDINGNPVQITDDMWSPRALNLPEGISGTITGSSGNVLTFTEVEVIKSI